MEKQVIWPKHQRTHSCCYFHTFSRMDSTTGVSANRLGLCDRHHISNATNILGLAFRNIKKFLMRTGHEYKF